MPKTTQPESNTPMENKQIPEVMALVIKMACARMVESKVDSIGIFQSGVVRLTGRWGCTTFASQEDFSQWIMTGVLSDSAQTKFAEFDPHRS